MTASKIKKIKLIIFDVDGVLTDGGIYHTANGDEFKRFDIQDGLGIKLLQKVGIQTAIITGRQSTLVDIRARELTIHHVYQGQTDKKAAYNELLDKLGLTTAEVAYVGDDLPDLSLIRQSGFGVAVNNATAEVKQHADYVTHHIGGHGAIREIAEYVIKTQGAWSTILESYL